MSDNGDARIQVAVRIRPSNEREKFEVTALTRAPGQETTVTVISDEVTTSVNDGVTQSFSFDMVFDDSDDQQRVYEDGCLGIVDSALDGRFVTIFAYGQTGSGKTHTVLGKPAAADGTLQAETGLFLRIFDALFDYRRKMQGKLQVVIALSAVEIYVNTIHDLLGGRNIVELRGGSAESRLVGLQCFEVSSITEVLRHFDVANKARSVAETKMNSESSRSHALFFIDLFFVPLKTGAPPATVRDLMAQDGTVTAGSANAKHARISLIDLAGSERVKKSGVEGQNLKEATAINQSLLTLGKVINGLYEGQTHIPFRESILTSILKPALVDPNARLLLIGQLSPAADSVSESLSTLKFCDRLKGLKPPENSSNQPDLVMLQAVNALGRQAAAMAGDVAVAAARHDHVVLRPRWSSKREGAPLPQALANAETAVRSWSTRADAERQAALDRIVDSQLQTRVREKITEFEARFNALRSKVQTAAEEVDGLKRADAANEAEADAQSKAATLAAKKNKKIRVQLEEKREATTQALAEEDANLEQVTIAALAAVGAPSKQASLLSPDEEQAWAAEQAQWQVKEANHCIVETFARLCNPLASVFSDVISTVQRCSAATVEAKQAKKRAKKVASSAGPDDRTEIVSRLIPDIVHFSIDRAVEIAEKIIDPEEHYGWFDIRGASSRVTHWHYWDPPLITTPQKNVGDLSGVVDAHDETTLSDDDSDGGTPAFGSPTAAGSVSRGGQSMESLTQSLELTHAQAIQNAREKRRQAKQSTATSRQESEEANKHYLMTVYDSPTLLQDVSRFLHSGTILLKHGRNGTPHKRRVWVSMADGHRSVVWVDPDATPPAERSAIPVSQIAKIVLGPYSKVFKRHPTTPADAAFFLSFSLYTRDNRRTLDVVADSLVDFEAWVLGLAHLVQVDPKWGAPMAIKKDDPVHQLLSAREAVLCSEENIPPQTYLAVKKRVSDHRDNIAHQLAMFDNDPVLAFHSLGGIHAPQVNHRGAVLMTKGELRFHCSKWNIDIFRVCKIWQLFRDLEIVYDPSYLPATCFGTSVRS